MSRHARAIALVAGLASACGFAPLGVWPLTLTCFAVLIVLVGSAPTRGSAFLRGWLFGVGHFTVGLNWIAHAFDYQDAMPHWFGYIGVVLLSLYLAVYPAFAAAVAWSFRSDRSAFRIAFAAAWIATEYARATFFTGFAWNPLGVLWIGTPVAWLATFVGTYGLSGLTMIVVAIVLDNARDWGRRLVAGAGAWPRAIRDNWEEGTWITTLVAPVLIVGGAMLWIVLGVTFRASIPDPTTRTSIRVVQPNTGLNAGRDPALARAGLDRLSTLSGKPGLTPRLIFWPEAALNDGYEIAYDERLRDELARLLGARDILLTGGTRLEYRNTTDGLERRPVGATNSVFTLDSRGSIGGRYDKAHLVPYGEYLPMRTLLTPIGLARLVPGDLDFLPGPGPRTLALPGGVTAGVQLCYEIIFSGQVVDRAHRPMLIFNPSNDAWFGKWGPPQHLAQARLRALEEGLPVVRSTPTGVSAVIDANGRIAASVPLGQAGFIETQLPIAHPPTLFAKHGNLLPLALALGLAVTAVAQRVRRR